MERGELGRRVIMSLTGERVEAFARYTWIGAKMNGRKTRPF